MTELSASSADNDIEALQYVGFWIRFVAFLIDSVVASIIISPLVVMIAGEVDLSGYDMEDPQQLMELLTRLSINLSFDMTLMGVAVILFWIYRSATPGKMVFSAIIIDAQHGGKPTPVQLIIRYLGYFINLFALGLGFVWIGLNDRKQGWHDKMAGTVVVKSKVVKSKRKSVTR